MTKFPIKEAYCVAVGCQPKHHPAWEQIFKMQGLQQLNFSVWQGRCDDLPTAEFMFLQWSWSVQCSLSMMWEWGRRGERGWIAFFARLFMGKRILAIVATTVILAQVFQVLAIGEWVDMNLVEAMVGVDRDMEWKYGFRKFHSVWFWRYARVFGIAWWRKFWKWCKIAWQQNL